VIYLQVKKPSHLFYTKSRVKSILAVGLLLSTSEFSNCYTFSCRALHVSSSAVCIRQSVCVMSWSSVGYGFFIPRYVCAPMGSTTLLKTTLVSICEQVWCKITHESIDRHFEWHYDIISGVLWTILVHYSILVLNILTPILLMILFITYP